MTTARILLVIGVLVLACAPATAQANPVATATVRLTPVCTAGSPHPDALDIALSLSLDRREGFELDDSVFGTSGMAALISDVHAVDQKGALSLVRPPGARGHDLSLRPARRTVGLVTFSYRARAVATTATGARQGLRQDAAGIGGLGAFFLVLPESSHVYRIRVEWGPTACPTRTDPTIHLSSFGEDTVETTGVLDSLRRAAYFSGNPSRVAVDDGAMHVRAAFFGPPAFDPTTASGWAARAFAAERAFFGDDDPTPYQLFFRVLPEMNDRANGVGQLLSFVSAIGPKTVFGPALRRNIAHEMLHRWLGLRLRLAGPEGENFWFTEGFTVHYAALLTFRARLISADEFVSALNEACHRLFASKYASASNEEIRRGFFANDALSVIPYARGALYAAEVDAAIRRSSKGARSLDDLVRALYRQALAAPENAAGLRELPEHAFRQALKAELGQAGLDRFDAVIVHGDFPEPPADAFGPCFGQKPGAAGHFEWVRVPGVPDDRC